MPGSPTDGEGAASVAIAANEYLWFVDLALGQMTAIVEELGDELVNRRPPFRDANSAYAIVTHCLGVMEYWGGATVAERPVQRDRAAEFTATGDVAGLLRRTEHARRRLREDMVGLERGGATGQRAPRPRRSRALHRDQGGGAGARFGGAVPAPRADGDHPGCTGGQPAPMTDEGTCRCRIPIACSLDGASFRERAEEWRALVRSSSVTSVSVQPGDTAVRLVLGESDDALTTAVALAQREKHCCPFFDVSVALEADRRTLILAVPDGAEDVLAAFVALLGDRS